MAQPSLEAEQASNPAGAAAPPRHSLSGRLLIASVHILRLLPFAVRSALGYCVGFVVGLVPTREHHAARLQLAAFLGNGSRLLVARTFANAGRTLLESLNLKPMLRKAASRVAAPQWDQVQSWLSDGRPLVALTAHTGNWDLLAAYTISRGVPLTTVGREARNPAAHQVLCEVREGYGIETIWRSDRSGVKRLLACMKERRTVAALIDQDTHVESLFVPFFGEPASTPAALIGLGQKCNARFVSAFMFRTGPMRFETFIEELDSSLPVEELLAEYNRRLEALVRRFPNQWVWFHNRWRSRPGGVRPSFREYLAWLRSKLS